jgi:hypothetical protein
MVRIKCPHCGAVHDVDDSRRGQICRCGACEKDMQIPTRATVLPVPLPDTSIRPDLPRNEASPFTVSPARPERPADWSAGFAPEDAVLFLEKQITADVPPEEKKQRRRRKSRRRRLQPDSLSARLRYYTGAIGTFGWILVGLLGLWLGCVALALVSPDRWRLLLTIGGGLVLIGNIWIAFIAYQDSQVFGMLCFCTFLFTYAYIFMNPQETWKPAALTGLGFLFTVSGLLGPYLIG